MKVNGDLKVNCGLKPIILFDAEALDKILYITEEHNQEWQWWHCVQRIVKDGHILYYLHDLFIPEQVVGGADVESDPIQMQKMWQEVAQDRGLKLKELNPIIQSATVWCHSHVNMNVNPSKTDDEQWEEQKNMAISGGNQDKPQLMLIINKRKECFNRVYDPELGLEFEKVPVRVRQSEVHEKLDEIISTKFKEMPKTATIDDIKDKAPAGKPAVTTTGHVANCKCPVCKDAEHIASCQCPDCQKKSRTL